VGPTPDRRDFLGLLLGGAAGFALPSTAFGQRPATSTTGISVTPLSDHLIHLSDGVGNVIAAIGPESVLLVNGGGTEHSSALLAAVASLAGGKKIQYLFNTDWHREHTGSNETLGKSGATIIAHERTREYLGAEIYVDWQKQTYAPLPMAARPTQTFYTSDKMTIGTERVEFGHLGQAHTDAAIYVHFPVANVLVAGGALSVTTYPIADYTTGGWPGGLLAANKTLLALANAETRIVPGTGPIQTRADLQAQHDMLAAMMDRIPKMMKQGFGPDDILAAAPTKEFDARWGNPDLFVTTACRGLWLHVRELGGIV
jgi:glyoxylase-like metal-dependent hydrolase (beta-lactamase superfamily II)